jgi:hypothetical protein
MLLKPKLLLAPVKINAAPGVKTSTHSNLNACERLMLIEGRSTHYPKKNRIRKKVFTSTVDRFFFSLLKKGEAQQHDRIVFGKYRIIHAALYHFFKGFSKRGPGEVVLEYGVCQFF